MRRIIAALSSVLLLCGTALAAPAGDVAERIAARLGARLEQFPVVRADFIQTKEMAAFKKPLVTRGRLVFSRQNGVLWQIEQPLKLTYVLQETRMVEIGDDGTAQVRTAQDVPGIAQVGRIFRGLLGGQTKALGDLFDSTGSGDAERAWTLILTPRNPQVAQFIRRITLTGGKQVDSIRVEEASGDTATMRFQHTSEATAISAEEGSLFGR